MPMTLSGNGQIGGLTPGGLPDGSVKQEDLATNVAGNGPCFSAYKNALQAIPLTTWTKLLFQAEEYDFGTTYDAGNSRFICVVPGVYSFTCAATAHNAYCAGQLSFYKNGALAKGGVGSGNGDTTSNAWLACADIYLNVGDVVEAYIYLSIAQDVRNGSPSTYFSGFLARAA